jgi:hypothetical protein
MVRGPAGEVEEVPPLEDSEMYLDESKAQG